MNDADITQGAEPLGSWVDESGYVSELEHAAVTPAEEDAGKKVVRDACASGDLTYRSIAMC